MSISYNRLWKLLVKKKMNKLKLRDDAKICNQTLSKLSKNQYVSLEILERICKNLDCKLEEIVEYIPDKKITKNNNTIKIASLFSGIGGFEDGINKSCIKSEVVFASEIEKFARISYEANFPNHNLNGDITKIHEKDIPDHDILIAGFPCQAFSIAGKREGFNDTRGTLFFEVARILNEKKPKIVLLENVENLISHNKSNTIKIILTILNELDYTVDFSIINSSEMGVPQSRSRTFIVGIKDRKTEKFLKDERSLKVNSLKIELNNSKFNGFNFFSNLKYFGENKIISDILEKNVDEKYYYDTLQINKFLSELNIDNNKKDNKIIKLFDLPKEIHNDQERQRRVHSVNGISPTLLARSDTTKILVGGDNRYKIRKLTPIENLRTQGFSEEFIHNLLSLGVSDTQLYKQSGNAVSPPVVREIFNLLKKYI